MPVFDSLFAETARGAKNNGQCHLNDMKYSYENMYKNMVKRFKKNICYLLM